MNIIRSCLNAAHAQCAQLRNYGADFVREGFELKPPFEIPRSATGVIEELLTGIGCEWA